MPNFDAERLRRLPQRPNEVWQGGVVPVLSWLTKVADLGDRAPCLVAWLALQDNQAWPAEVCESGEQGFGKALASLLDFATDTAVGGYRPGRVEVCDVRLAEYLQPVLPVVHPFSWAAAT